MWFLVYVTESTALVTRAERTERWHEEVTHVYRLYSANKSLPEGAKHDHSEAGQLVRCEHKTVSATAPRNGAQRTRHHTPL